MKDSKEQDQKAEGSKKMVKVRVLKHVGPHAPGEIVEVPEDQAKDLCQVSHVYHGQTIVEQKRAVLLNEEGKAADGSDEAEGADFANMTMAEARAKGLVNRVETPAHDNDPVLKKAYEETKPVTLATQTPPHSSLPPSGEAPVPEVSLGLKADKTGYAYDPVLAAEQSKKAGAKDGLKSAKKDQKATDEAKASEEAQAKAKAKADAEAAEAAKKNEQK